MDIRNEVVHAIESSTIQPCPVLIWISIPCAGGTTWSYVNLQHESAKLKVEYHRHVFEKIWSSMVDFLNLIRHLSPKIAIEWPAHCIYWKFDRVEKFVESINSLESHLMDAWLVLLTKKVNPSRNHGLFKPIVLQLSLHLMDCLVMVVILMFKAEVMT